MKCYDVVYAQSYDSISVDCTSEDPHFIHQGQFCAQNNPTATNTYSTPHSCVTSYAAGYFCKDNGIHNSTTTIHGTLCVECFGKIDTTYRSNNGSTKYLCDTTTCIPH